MKFIQILLDHLAIEAMNDDLWYVVVGNEISIGRNRTVLETLCC